MEDKKFIEAKSNLKVYFNDGLIKKQAFDDKIFSTYLKNHHESISVAEKLFTENVSDLWVIVSSYYSMFYIANAYLFSLGFKVGHKIAHKVTFDCLVVYGIDDISANLIENYAYLSEEALMISENLVESFDFERSKRSKIQYETTDEIKKSKAKTSLDRAKKFGLEIMRLI